MFEAEFTPHGMLVASDRARHLAFVLRWSGSEPGAAGELAALALDRAQSWPEFQAALARWKMPARRFSYADVEGRRGFQAAALIPVQARLGRRAAGAGMVRRARVERLAIARHPPARNRSARRGAAAGDDRGGGDCRAGARASGSGRRVAAEDRNRGFVDGSACADRRRAGRVEARRGRDEARPLCAPAERRRRGTTPLQHRSARAGGQCSRLRSRSSSDPTGWDRSSGDERARPVRLPGEPALRRLRAALGRGRARRRCCSRTPQSRPMPSPRSR